jgi:hypothetical protein
VILENLENLENLEVLLILEVLFDQSHLYLYLNHLDPEIPVDLLDPVVLQVLVVHLPLLQKYSIFGKLNTDCNL